MKKQLIKLSALCLSTLFLFGCQKEDDLQVMKTSNTLEAHVLDGCDVIDFDQYATGFITQVDSRNGIGPINVLNKARNSSGDMVNANRAMIFDTFAPTGEDYDLYTGVGSWNMAMLGKVLIINHLGEEDTPNDNQWGGVISLDFSTLGPVDIKTVKVLDIDPYEDESYIKVYSSGGVLLKSLRIIPAGNNMVQTVEVNTTGVARLELILAGSNGVVGSGAIDDIVFCKEQVVNQGCTRTQGYWKTHALGSKHYDNTWAKITNANNFYSTGMSYMVIMDTAPKKVSAYFILAHQFIATELNRLAGASITPVTSQYNLAKQFFMNAAFGAEKWGSYSRQDLIDWANALDKYNNGKMGVPHCD
jgi:hypothetical protein